jgi:hypothetical protein
VIVALTVLTSSQGIFIAFSKKAGQYDYSVTTANLMVSSHQSISLDPKSQVFLIAGKGGAIDRLEERQIASFCIFFL